VSEPDPSLEEELEAAALRAALDEGRGVEHLPDDALEAASLLRFSGATGELSDAQSARLRNELLASLPARRPAPRRPRIMIWLAALGGVAALAALLVTTRREPAASYATRTSEPPTLALAPAEPQAIASAAQVAPGEARGAVQKPLAVARNAAPSLGASGADVEQRSRADRARSATGAAPGAHQELALAAPVGRAAPPAAKAKPASPTTVAAPTTRQQLELASSNQRRALLARVGSDKLAAAGLRPSDGRGKGGPAEPERTREELITALADTKAASFDDGDKRPLQQDLYCKLAQLSLRQGQPAQALEWARQGIALDGPASGFLGLLWQTQGEAHEALGDKDAAARSYLQAQAIAAQLLNQELEP
jgi:hypothetical protein